jgi:hypothetical protein
MIQVLTAEQIYRICQPQGFDLTTSKEAGAIWEVA